MPPQQYTNAQLTAIGHQASNRLPPASAMQGMFLYEMQRGAENERLFQNVLFQLARGEEHAADQNTVILGLTKRVTDLTEQVEDLQNQLKRKDVHERMATSQVRLDVFQSKLKQLDQALDEQSKRLTLLENVNSSNSENGVSHTEITDTTRGQVETIPEGIVDQISEMEQDITVLFEERDAIADLHGEMRARMENLEKATLVPVEAIEDVSRNMQTKITQIETAMNKRLSKFQRKLTATQDDLEECERSLALLSPTKIEDNFEQTQQDMRDLESSRELQPNEISKLGMKLEEYDQRIKGDISVAEQQIRDRASKAEVQAELSKLDQKSAQRDFQINLQIREVKQKATERANKAEKDLEERIADAEREMARRLSTVKHEASEEVAQAKQHIIDRVTASQKSRCQHIVALNDEIKAQVAKVDNQTSEELEKIKSQASQLQSTLDSFMKEQQERFSKLEDLVRALTAQSPSSGSTASQCLPVQTTNGTSLSLSIPKGHSFISQKENIRTFTPGKQWMT